MVAVLPLLAMMRRQLLTPAQADATVMHRRHKTSQQKWRGYAIGVVLELHRSHQLPQLPDKQPVSVCTANAQTSEERCKPHEEMSGRDASLMKRRVGEMQAS